MRPTDPFDKHPAAPAALEIRAGALVRLADEAIDHEVVTARAYDPAVAEWDGIAAAELRSAPAPVRAQAEDVASRVAWAAVPLQVWAEHVRQFNHTVDTLVGRYQQLPVDVELRVRRQHPDFDALVPHQKDYLRGVEREVMMKELNDGWWNAYNVHVDEGERDVAAMFRHGPTWANLSAARALGILPPGPATYFEARWTWAATIEEAQRIAAVIIDPRQMPTDAELELLADFMSAHADNEEFAFALLDAIGPDGTIQLNIGLAALGADGAENHASLAAIQQGLATALAVATAQRGHSEYGPDGERYYPAEYELPASWTLDLVHAAEHRYPLYPNGAGNEMIYGYQALGPLLGYGGYDEWFLGVVGGSMIDFEMQIGGGGEWHAHGSSRGGTPIDFRLFGTPDQIYSYDPMVGLMAAFEDNPYGARAAFAGRIEDGHLPRVEYLVTERYQTEDDRLWLDEAHLHQFGRVLEHATGITWGADVAGQPANLYPPDQRSYLIFESIVHGVAVNDVVTSTHMNDRDIVDDLLRPYLGRITAGYIDDVHWSMAHGGNTDGTRPGQQDAVLDPHELQIFLAELGRNAQARETVMLAEEIYVGALFDYYLGGDHEHPQAAAENMVLAPAGQIFGALNVGAETQVNGDWEDHVAVRNGSLENRHLVYGIGLNVAEDLGMPGTINFLMQEALDRSLEQQRDGIVGEAVGSADYEIGTMHHTSGQRLADQAALAAYRHLDPDELPEHTRAVLVDGDGQLKPMYEWYHDPDSPERRAWDNYLGDAGAGSTAASLIGQAEQGYHDGHDRADRVLRGSDVRD